MNLGIFLAAGDSFGEMKKSGQDVRFIKFYLNFYARNFNKVYIFSYSNEQVNNLPKNVILVKNKYSLPRYIYGILLPFLNSKIIYQIDVIRIFHLYGCFPGLLTKFFFNKNYIFSYSFDYQTDAKISGKIPQLIIYYFLTPIFIYFATYIIAASKVIYGKLPIKKRVYIPNGVDTKVFRPLRVKKSKTPVVLSIGRLEQVKNYENLISCLENSKINLKIIGTGSLRKHLIDLAKEKNVTFQLIDNVSNNKLPRIYNQATIFVLSSLNEGHPKVLLEAMSCGLCCIGTNVPGIKEIIKNNQNGVLTKTDPVSLRRAIFEVLEAKKQMLQLGTNARKFIQKKYELSELLKREVEILQRL